MSAIRTFIRLHPVDTGRKFNVHKTLNSEIIFALNTLFPKFLHKVWFTSFTVNYAMKSMTENVLHILL